MKFTIDRKALLEGLKFVGAAAGMKSSLPVLSSVLFEAEKGSVRLTASNLEVWLSVEVDAEVEKHGALCLPVGRTRGLLAAVPDERLTIAIAGKKRAVTVTGETLEATIFGLDREEFPAMLECDGEEIEQIDLADPIARALPAVSDDESRYVLTGAYLHAHGPDGHMRLVATNGRVLFLVEKEIPLPASTSVIIPTATLQAIVALGDPVSLRLGEKSIRAASGRRVVVSKLIDGNFPNYAAVIPDRGDRVIRVGRAALQRAIAVARNFSVDSKSKEISIVANAGGVTVLGQSPETGEASVRIDAPQEIEETVKLNSHFLEAALHAVRVDDLAIEVEEASAPLVIRTSEVTTVVMPMRMDAK